MSMDADAIADRRRLKRRLVLWRLLAIVAIVAAVGFPYWRDGAGLALGDRVAQIDVVGVITDDENRLQAIRRLGTDPSVKAVIVRIDSPGGTVVGGEELYRALRDVAASKPLVAVIGGTGASAGYMTALAADRILARENSITGSIGVVLQTFQLTELLNKLGIDPAVFKSSPLKDQPNPFEPITAEARAAVQAVVDDTYRWFVELVAQRRALSPVAALQLADGRIYTGRQAASLNLIDGVGGIEDARAWLAETKGVGRDLPLRRVVPAGTLEIPTSIFGLVRKTLFSETLRVDGLVSLWQP